mgnify:CR=1 FL=1
MPDIYEMNTFDLRASLPSVRVRRYEEAIMSYRSALVLVATFCALPVAAFNAPAPLAHCISSTEREEIQTLQLYSAVVASINSQEVAYRREYLDKIKLLAGCLVRFRIQVREQDALARC